MEFELDKKGGEKIHGERVSEKVVVLKFQWS